MKLNEAEMRMAYQIESTDPNAVLNKIYMTWRLSRNQATRDTAESLMAKLRSLSNNECMDLIREVQANYRLPGKPQTIGEMLAEARQKSGAQKLAGHDIMALERFDPDTRHMIVFDVLSQAPHLLFSITYCLTNGVQFNIGYWPGKLYIFSLSS